MKIYNEIDLYRYNTMKLHSIARIMYEPENVDELLAIFRKLKKEDTARVAHYHSTVNRNQECA